MSLLGSYIINTLMKRKGAWVERKLDLDLKNLKESQENLLLQIVRKNASTEFGVEYGFHKIHSVQDYRKQIPVLDYEKLRPYIEKQDKTGLPILIKDNPIFYAVTSGTTGKPKFIPVHKGALETHKQSTNLFVCHLLKERPKVLSGKILAIVSPAVEGYMADSGLPYGSTSGQMYENMSSLAKRKYIVPSEVFGIEEYDLKYRTILRLAIQEPNITYLTTANPSTIAKLASLIPACIEQMIVDVEKGVFSEMQHLGPQVQKVVAAKLKANKKRAQQLRLLTKQGSKLRIQDLWPHIQAVGTWTGGTSSIFLDQLQGQFPANALLRDLGYLSSEFRGSVPVMSGTNAGVPTFWNGYYEFVEQGEWDSGIQNFLGLHDLQDKKNYYIFITTDYGLYRYHMNDVVQVDGFYKTAPMIRFMQKGKGVTSITGEKLYESQVIEAVGRLEKKRAAYSEFYMMSCDPHSAHYTLYYELSPDFKDQELSSKGTEALEEIKKFQSELDLTLSEINIEYHAKRQSGRLKPVRVCILKRGTYQIFKKFYLDQGQREAQFKIVALQFSKDIKFDFSPYIGWDGAQSDQSNLLLLASTRHAVILSAELGL
jgi:hypothetical protein